MKRLSFSTDIFSRPKINRVTDAFTTLNHYCQVNYSVPSDSLRKLIHPRFDPFPIISNDQAIISAVVFQEKNFHFPSLPFLGRYNFSQTNYRTYVIDKETGRRTVWFFGNTLDHFSILIPQLVWRFPWHKASIQLHTTYHNAKYEKYSMYADSEWGEARMEVQDSGRKAIDEDFPGFPDKETALVYLTQPMSGHFYRNEANPRLACWEIYHAPMDPNVGHIMDGGGGVHFKVFSEVLGLIEPGAKPYNILLQNEIDYNIFLPPLESISKGSRYP